MELEEPLFGWSVDLGPKQVYRFLHSSHLHHWLSSASPRTGDGEQNAKNNDLYQAPVIMQMGFNQDFTRLRCWLNRPTFFHASHTNTSDIGILW